MTSFFAARTVALPLVLLCAVTTAAAGGGPAEPRATAQNATTETSYRCQGGLRVQVFQMPGTDRVRVKYAGETLTLHPVHDAAGVHYQNASLSWNTRGTSSFMKNLRTGRLMLSGCVQD